MRRYRALLARLSVVAMLASLLALAGNTAAQATTQAWSSPVQLSGLAQAQEVLTRPNGDVMVGCSSRSAANAVTTVTASGRPGDPVAPPSSPTIHASPPPTPVRNHSTA